MADYLPTISRGLLVMSGVLLIKGGADYMNDASKGSAAQSLFKAPPHSLVSV